MVGTWILGGLVGSGLAISGWMDAQRHKVNLEEFITPDVKQFQEFGRSYDWLRERIAQADLDIDATKKYPRHGYLPQALQRMQTERTGLLQMRGNLVETLNALEDTNPDVQRYLAADKEQRKQSNRINPLYLGALLTLGTALVSGRKWYNSYRERM
jgi:hypothetical protein